MPDPLRLDPEDLRQLARELSIELRAMRGSVSFVRLAVSWLRRIRAVRVEPNNERRHILHLRPLWGLREGELTKAKAEEVLFGLLRPKGTLSAATVNKVRSTAKLILDDATGNGRWFGHNPFALAAQLPLPQVVYQLPRREDLASAFRLLRADYRRIALFVLLLGIRPGEVLALRREDFDLVARFVHVRRSNARDVTKTGRERILPIPDALLPHAVSQLYGHDSDLLFPGRGGARRNGNRLTDILARAMERAGVTRRFDFYVLRHCFSTWGQEDGVDPVVIDATMGHVGANTREVHYTHVGLEYRRAELNKLRFETA